MPKKHNSQQLEELEAEYHRLTAEIRRYQNFGNTHELLLLVRSHQDRRKVIAEHISIKKHLTSGKSDYG